MKLGVFGRAEDPLVIHTSAIARGAGHHAEVFSLAAVAAGSAVSCDTDTWLVQGNEVEACDAFVMRSYPAVYALLAQPQVTDTAEGWFKRGALQNERSSFAQSLIMDMELRGKPVVNPLLATAPYDHKPLQLAALKRAGVALPHTLITNHPASAGLFVDAMRELGCAVVVKPSGGGAETLLVDDDVMQRLNAATASPFILQERVQGEDIRVTVVGERIVSCVSIASTTLDYRSGAAYRTGGASYVEHVLPPEVAAMCLRAARACHHVLSGIDLKFDGARYVLLEANSAPVYLDIERKLGHPITLAIVQWLADRCAHL